MAMVVQHNIQAMNANRLLGVTTGLQTKSTEKLSSGYKINRAADDAAGLTISEKMRKQIRGLDQASENGQDGVSSVQTAEGAMTEIHSMLQRMNELAVQAANGTNSESDRQAIQDEVEQLTTEIDRVAETTKFNEIYLLKGNADGETVTQNVNAHDAGLEGKLVDNKNGTFTFTPAAMEDDAKISIAGKEYTIDEDATEDAATAKDVIATLNKDPKAGDEVAITAGVTTANYKYKDAEKWAADTIVAKLDEAIAAGKKGDVITVGSTKWTYKEAIVSVDNAAGPSDLFGNSYANLATPADGDTVTIKKAADGSTETYTYMQTPPGGGTAGWYKDGTRVTNLNSGNVPLADGDVCTIVDADGNGAGKPKTTIWNIGATGCAEVDAGFYNGTTQATANTDITDAVTDGTETTATIVSGNTTTTMTVNGEKAPAGWYKVDGANVTDEPLENSVLTEGVTGTITRAAGAAGDPETFTVVAPGNNISPKKALEMMKDELIKASSIGTDTKAEATVNDDGTITITQGSVDVIDTLSFNLHVGADADMTNKISVDIDSMSCAGLGIKDINLVGDGGDDGGIAATYAIDAIEDAIAKVSEQRSALGAVQNRLEHTISNLDNIVENTQSAESRIRDTDMAEEMVEYSKNNILAQAGQSMLAQANQSSQGVLSLLQ